MQTVNEDPAADPQHRRRPDRRQSGQHHRHGVDQSAAQRAGRGRGTLGQMQADIIHLHDQRHGAIDHHGDQQADQGQGRRLGRQRTLGQIRQGDGGDLGREDQVRADRRTDHLLFLLGGRNGQIVRRGFVASVTGQLPPEFFGGLEAEIGAAGHQQRRQRPGREGADHQRSGQEDEEFVLQRAYGDLADDRQLARGRKAHRVTRGHRGVVDHHASRLYAGPAGGGGHVVDRGRRHLGDGRDVVEKGGKT